ncbi:MAG: C25 family cysteine peptidase, partial [Bacteroidota bacterium]
MKKILHFAGGDALIQNQVRADFTALTNSIENSTFGADVTSFFKTSVDVVQEIPQTQQVRNLIDEGAAMIVFYGHSSSTTLDFDIGKPEEYDNKGRYPIFYAIGCNTNTIFEVPSTLSEDYVFIEDKGTIGFFGSTSLTQLTNLSRYARGFYENFGSSSYGQTIGEIIQATIVDYEAENAFTSQHIKHVLMFHGDPTLRLYPHQYPDFVLNTQESAIDPNLIDTQLDSFQTTLSFVNIGRSVSDSLQVTINQIFPNGKKQFLATLEIPSPKFETKLSIRLPILKKVNNIGKNQLEIVLDPENKIEEGGGQSKSNNTKLLSFFVVDNNVQPIFPSNYSIVQNPELSLYASSSNAFSELAKFYMEIDTTESFNSSFKKRTEIEQKGGLLSWKLPFEFEEKRAYYWRVSIDSSLTAGQGFNWQTSSFVYLPESPKGWNQSHYDQFNNNQLNGLEIKENRQQFREKVLEFGVTTSSTASLGFFGINITKDGF